ncbi:MAG: GAF domain-containing protein [Anaerolineae bacterium]
MSQEPVVERYLQAISEIAEAMRATAGPQRVLEKALNVIVDKLGYKGASVRLLDAERKTLLLEAACGLSQEYLDKGAVNVDRSQIDREVLAGTVVGLRDVTDAPEFQYSNAARNEGIRSILAAPLMRQGRAVGVLRIYTSEPHDFGPDERAFVGVTATLIARAIATASLFHAWYKIVQEVNSTLKVEDVLIRLLHNTIAELNYKGALIRLLDTKAQVMRLVAAEGLSAAYLGKGDVRIGDSTIDSEVLSGRPVTIYDITTDNRWQYRQAAEREGIRSVQAVPLAVHGTVIGVLRVYSSQPHRFTAEEVDFLSAIANLGAIAIENARLHQALSDKYETLKTDASGWYRFLTLS